MVKNLHQANIRQWVEIEGKTLKWVAGQQGCCVSTIQTYCRNHGIRPSMGPTGQDWPVGDIRKWVEVDGHTHSWVGKKIGCRHQTVSKICKKNGIETQRSGPRSGAGHPEWKGGRILIKGYWMIYAPDHPNCTKQNRVAEHRLVMEKKIGRYLTRKEVVHHLDHDRQNNDPDNLWLFANNGEHLAVELAGRVPKWSPEGYQRMEEARQRRSNRAKLKHDGDPQAQEGRL